MLDSSRITLKVTVEIQVTPKHTERCSTKIRSGVSKNPESVPYLHRVLQSSIKTIVAGSFTP